MKDELLEIEVDLEDTVLLKEKADEVLKASQEEYKSLKLKMDGVDAKYAKISQDSRHLISQVVY